MPREALEQVLAAGGTQLQRQQLFPAVESVVTELSLQLSQCSESLPRHFGLAPESDWVDADDEDLESLLSPGRAAPAY